MIKEYMMIRGEDIDNMRDNISPWLLRLVLNKEFINIKMETIEEIIKEKISIGEVLVIHTRETSFEKKIHIRLQCSDSDDEMMVKVILIGDSAVGKTNIMSRYLRGEFLQNSKATIGVEFGSKLFNVDGHSIKAQIWDTAGQEKYKAITGTYYKGSKGAFIYMILLEKTFLIM